MPKSLKLNVRLTCKTSGVEKKTNEDGTQQKVPLMRTFSDKKVKRHVFPFNFLVWEMWETCLFFFTKLSSFKVSRQQNISAL